MSDFNLYPQRFPTVLSKITLNVQTEIGQWLDLKNVALSLLRNTLISKFSVVRISATQLKWGRAANRNAISFSFSRSTIPETRGFIEKLTLNEPVKNFHMFWWIYICSFLCQQPASAALASVGP